MLTGVSSSNIEDLECGLDILSDDVPNSAVALVPVKRLLVLIVTVFPVFALSVLSHYLFL